jgi:hypothetical protein
MPTCDHCGASTKQVTTKGLCSTCAVRAAKRDKPDQIATIGDRWVARLLVGSVT